MFFFTDSKKERKDKSSLPERYRNLHEFRKRTFLPTSLKGSLTLEAACIMPILVCGMLAVMYFFLAVVEADKIAEGLHETGERMAAYACITGEDKESGENVVSLLYAANCLNKRVGRNVQGFHLLHSSIYKEDEMIDLAAEYQIKVRVPFFPSENIKILQRARVRAWVGSRKNKEADSGEKVEMVYVTVTGSVYHLDRGCSHLKLSIRAVAEGSVERLRNQYGAKYYPCESCVGRGISVYITEMGNRYHSSLSCSGLKRSILTVPLSQVSGRGPCSRCGG